jgi:hypothetical protein
MQVQDVINASSTDFRNVLASTSPDSALFVSWVDRIHKDALHTGIYNPLLQLVSTISVVSGTSAYAIPVGGGAIRRIQLVYDRTFDRVLIPIETLMYPSNEGDSGSPRQPLQIPKAMVTASTMEQWPEYYKREGTSNLIIFPAPQKTAFNGTYEIHYEMQVPDLTATTSTLLIPDDGIDQVVAGVNSYVAQFLHLDTEATFWTQQYQALKMGQPINS